MTDLAFTTLLTSPSFIEHTSVGLQIRAEQSPLRLCGEQHRPSLRRFQRPSSAFNFSKSRVRFAGRILLFLDTAGSVFPSAASFLERCVGQ